MSEWSKNQIIQVAILYYKKDNSQKEISEMMQLSKMTISRILQKAKELNFIDIDVTLPFKINKKLGLSIEEKYRIEQATVVKIEGKKQESFNEIGKVWAFYMGISDLNNKVLGVGVGNTVGSMVNFLTPMKTRNTHIIQLMGGLIDVMDSNPFAIVQNLCKKLKAKGSFLTSLAAVDNKKIRDEIISSNFERNSKLGTHNMAIFGIGDIKRGTLLSPDLIAPEEFKELKEKEAVGDILGHCFNKNGNFINSNLEDRLVSISIDKLREFKERIALVAGDYKEFAVKGALNSGIINKIVIDETLAKKII